VSADPMTDPPTDPMTDPMTEALDGLAAFILDADAQLQRILAERDEDGHAAADRTVPALARLRRARQRLAQVEADAERAVTQALGTGKKTVAGTQLDVHGGWIRREWQHNLVAHLLVENLLVDPLTGVLDTERLRQMMPLVYHVLNHGRMEWRVTDLTAAGISTDGLCKEEPKRMTVQFLSDAEAAAT
jgi:hypothetical protein